MKILYRNKIKGIDLELEAFDNVESESKCFEVDQIYEDIITGYNGLPEGLKKLRMMMYTYEGTLTGRYPSVINSKFMKFCNREFFRMEPNYLIDESSDVDLDSPIYVRIDYNNFRYFDDLIISYIKYELVPDDIKLIGPEDSYFNIYDGDEYLLNSWNYDPFIKPKYDTVNKFYENKRSLIEDQESEFIPDHGPAKTKYGELLRACQRVIYRFFNDGDSCNYIMDGNIISYLNIPKLIEEWIDEESEEYKFFTEQFSKAFEGPRIEYNKYIYYEEVGDMSIILVISTEFALIKTKEKYPEFLSSKNTRDSRYWER